MTPAAVGLVGLSALTHVGWNVLARRSAGTLRFMWMIAWGGGLAGTAVAYPALADPAVWRAWPLWAVSGICHAVYFTELGKAYETGQLASTYGLARGMAVLSTAALAFGLFHQHLAAGAWVGILVIASGVALLQRQARSGPAPRGGLARTALIGVVVTAYSLVDSRAVGVMPLSAYLALIFLTGALLMTPRALRAEAVDLRTAGSGLLAGVASMASYALMLAAYRLGPVAPLLALRQTAPALASLVGWVFLRERPSWATWLGTFGVMMGSVLTVLG